jgi:hypothetical protein
MLRKQEQDRARSMGLKFLEQMYLMPEHNLKVADQDARLEVRLRASSPHIHRIPRHETSA